jgi:nucleotide-binding universal stress UspA family protein
MSARRLPVRLFQSILCPVDFSPHSRVALQHAVAMSQRLDSRLTVMYADDPTLAAAAAAGDHDDVLTRQTTDALRRLLIRVGVRVDRDPSLAQVVSAVGHPASAIVTVAKRQNADLVVMGTQGRSGARKMIFGSVTEQVLRTTPVPLLAVPPRATGRAMKGWPRRNIVCAVELAPGDQETVDAGAAVARAFDTALTLVHVVAPTLRQPWLAQAVRDRDRRQLESARQRLEALAANVRTRLRTRVTARVLLGNPANGIATAAAATHAALIVLTLREGHGLFGPRQGSITYRVLSSSAIPVLARHHGRPVGNTD